MEAALCRLEIDEDEAPVIRLIFDRYLAGVSMENIAKEITALGYPTRDMKTRKPITRKKL